MKLIILYGPPGVGKLTVAKLLAKRIGYKLFHNHLTLEVVEAVFERDQKPFWQLLHKHRIDIFRAAAKHQIPGVIFTVVYFNKEDDQFFQEIIRIIERYKGQVLFVQLLCDKNILFNRLTNPSRRIKYKKLTNLKKFEKSLLMHDMFSPVPFEPNFTIDTTKLSPLEIVKKIQRYYQLKKIQKDD